jgi:hypothetical protein
VETRNKSRPVRVSESAHRTAISIADQLNLSMVETFDRAIDALEREMFFEQMNAAYGQLVVDEKLEEFKDEIAVWDMTLADGLD